MPVNVKGMIADTFMQLSREKNVDKITVKDLVERCGISRQTFYYHFQDLLEVIEWSMQQAFQTLLTRSLSSDDPEAVLRDFITASAEADVLLQKLLHSQRREQIEGIMVRSVRTYLQELLLPFRYCSVEYIVLGCTHYPFVRRAIRKNFGRPVEIIDGSGGTARQLKRQLAARELLTTRRGHGSVVFRNSDPDKLPMSRALFQMEY